MSTDVVQAPPPPLLRWGVVWRNLLAVVGGGLLWLTVASEQWDTMRWLFYLDISLGVACVVAMQFRRRWPLPVALFCVATAAFSASGGIAGGIAFISLATHRRLAQIIPVALLSLCAGQAYYEIQPAQENTWLAALGFNLAATGAAIAIGMYIGARRDLVASLQDRAERAEREQQLQISSARAQERNRIAREMHDVLAHRMSLVAMHAGALAYRDNLTPEESRATAEIIQANSHRALTDLREVLGVLRDSEHAIAPVRPQPTLCDLDELVADERAAGARVVLHNDLPSQPPVPESIGRTAYRVVQEALTNARKHAPNTQVDVDVHGEPGRGLSVQVRNPARVGSARTGASGGGFGLVGLAERATLTHGRFEHGLTSQGDFIVKAWLPWPV